MVMEVVQEDMGDGNMQCTDHPYKNTTPPGGICAFCLQEKLGKLVSSSFPVAVFPSSSSSSSPSFRSDFGGGNTASSAVTVRPHNASSSAASHHHIVNDCDEYKYQYYTRRSKMLFLLSTHRKKNKKKDGVLERSKSTTTPRRRGGNMHFLDDDAEDFSPHKRGFWSFLYLSSKHSSATKKGCERSSQRDIISSYPSSVSREKKIKKEELVVVEENDESPDEAALDRKVSRSRSVGCGSRSFSGDFFERISTGFGDCTLRRVESQREGNNNKHNPNKVPSSVGGQDCIKERVKCGGIFSGFMITSSSSSSSSSSYWVSSSTEDNNNSNNGKSASTPAAGSASTVRHHLAHGRSKSWGWAFASPMRAFGKPSSNGKRSEASNKNNATPNLAAIPSLLAVGG
ncbi:hypothetical protein ACH5RR_031094 [Cinchona calisaya]|uniref:Vitellogenin-like protein n=1 Tax=Cinchona calisaya TaxID=153742 RepID=A0ABD2YIL5_9GENT